MLPTDDIKFFKFSEFEGVSVFYRLNEPIVDKLKINK